MAEEANHGDHGDQSPQLPRARPMIVLVIIALIALATFIAAQTDLDTADHRTRQAHVVIEAEHDLDALHHAIEEAATTSSGDLEGLAVETSALADRLEAKAELLLEGNTTEGLPRAGGAIAAIMSGPDGLHARLTDVVTEARALATAWGNDDRDVDTTPAKSALADADTSLKNAEEAIAADGATHLRAARTTLFIGLSMTLVMVFVGVVWAINPLQRAVDRRAALIEAEREALESRVKARTADLEKHTRALERSNAELQRLATVAAHDLQEPLRSITSYMQLVEQRLGRDLDETTLEYIDFALQGTARMKVLLTDLLSYAQIGTTHEEMARVELDDVLRHVARDLDRRIKDGGATVTVQPNLPAVLGYRDEIRDAFSHMILNSLTYRHPDRAPHIEIGGTKEGERVHVTVADNGIGIDGRYADRVFQLFQRLHGPSEDTGTGIGLALCRKVMDHHDGRIWLESDGASGTTFHLMFHGPSTPRKAIKRSPTLPRASPIEERGRDLL